MTEFSATVQSCATKRRKLAFLREILVRMTVCTAMAESSAAKKTDVAKTKVFRANRSKSAGRAKSDAANPEPKQYATQKVEMSTPRIRADG
jgi:hypothetical protein